MKIKLALALSFAGVVIGASAASAQTAAKPTIVLVHGAFADALSWQNVIPILEKDGYNVVAVENPLSSLDDDIATTKQLIDTQKGPVVAVGHRPGPASGCVRKDLAGKCNKRNGGDAKADQR